MTVIAAARDPDGTIIMGSDGISCDESGNIYPVGSKIIRKHLAGSDILIASSGLRRISELISSLRIRRSTQTLRDLADEIARHAQDLAIPIKPGDDGTLQWEMLVAHAGRIHYIGYGHEIIDCEDYGAAGCGRDYALGALNALTESDLPAADRVSRALRAAATHDIHIGPPYTLEKLQPRRRQSGPRRKPQTRTGAEKATSAVLGSSRTGGTPPPGGSG